MGETTYHKEQVRQHYDKKVIAGMGDLSLRIAKGYVHHHEGWTTEQELDAVLLNKDNQEWLESFIYEKECELTEVLTNQLNPKPTKDSIIFDAGCGRGGSAFRLHEKFSSKVIGVSISGEQIKFAKQTAKKLELGSDQVEFHVGDMTKSDLPDASCNYIWALGSTEHVEDLGTMAHEIHRVGADQAQLLIYACTKNSAHPEGELFAKRADDWYKTRLHTISEYTEALDSAGWHIQTQRDYSADGARYWHARSLLKKGSGSEKFLAPGFIKGALDYYLILATK